MEKKAQVGWQELIPWIVGIFVLALIFFLYQIFYGKGEGALGFLKNLFTFGR